MARTKAAGLPPERRQKPLGRPTVGTRHAGFRLRSDLLEQAQLEADRRRVPLTAIVSEALRLYLAHPADPPRDRRPIDPPAATGEITREPFLD